MELGKIVAVDVDDTIADLIGRWLDLYNEEWDDDVTPDRITEWSVHEHVRCGHEIYDYLKREGLYEGVIAIDGALTGIKALRKMGFKIIFVTASYHEGKIQWLYDNGFASSVEEWVVAHDKSLIYAHYLIDDRIENVENFPHGLGLLFRRSWNAKKSVAFETWAEIIKFFENESSVARLNLWK